MFADRFQDSRRKRTRCGMVKIYAAGRSVRIERTGFSNCFFGKKFQFYLHIENIATRFRKGKCENRSIVNKQYRFNVLQCCGSTLFYYSVLWFFGFLVYWLLLTIYDSQFTA
jgi:hypothetical protein